MELAQREGKKATLKRSSILKQINTTRVITSTDALHCSCLLPCGNKSRKNEISEEKKAVAEEIINFLFM